MSKSISFWQPIYYPQPTCGQSIGNAFDEFFCLDGTRAIVLNKGFINGRKVEWVSLEHGKNSCKCIKIFLICTAVFAIFMLIGKVMFRCCHAYQIKPPSEHIVSQKPMSLTIPPESTQLLSIQEDNSILFSPQSSPPPTTTRPRSVTTSNPTPRTIDAIYYKAVQDKRPFQERLCEQLFDDFNKIHYLPKLRDDQIEQHLHEPYIETKDMEHPYMTNSAENLLAIALRVKITNEKFEKMYDHSWKRTNHGDTILVKWGIDPNNSDYRYTDTVLVIAPGSNPKLCLRANPQAVCHKIEGAEAIMPYSSMVTLKENIANLKQIIRDGEGEYNGIKFKLLHTRDCGYSN